MKTKEYVRPIPATWWLRNNRLMLYMVRELTSVFVGGYALFLLILLTKAGQGDVENDGKKAVLDLLQCPTGIALQLLALVFVVFHTVTWFQAAPKALVVWRGEDKVSPTVIAGGHFALWLVVSAVVLWLVRG